LINFHVRVISFLEGEMRFTIMGSPRRSKQKDWHAEQIKAAVRMTGVTLSELARRNGLSEGACRKSLKVAVPTADRIIADQLNTPLHKIWPSRYDEKGRRVIIHVREYRKGRNTRLQRLSEACE
jgi:Ner family transcriptional regulator